MKLVTGVLLAIPMLVYGASSSVTPDTLEARVQHQLNLLPYYTVFDDLSYRIEGDTVTLYGQVTKPSLENEAVSAVKEVAPHVNDQIEVLPLSSMDEGIRLRVFRAIYGYQPLFQYSTSFRGSIHIIVKNGDITLTGWVDNKMDKDLAFMRANTVPGTFRVTNNLRVTGT